MTTRQEPSFGPPPIREQIAQPNGTLPISWVSWFTDAFGILKTIENLQPIPATAASPGNQGTLLWDSNFIYVCVAPNVWKRVAISSW